VIVGYFRVNYTTYNETTTKGNYPCSKKLTALSAPRWHLSVPTSSSKRAIDSFDTTVRPRSSSPKRVLTRLSFFSKVDNMPKPEVGDPRFLAALDFMRRTGVIGIWIRYSDDELPIIWFVVVEFPDNKFEVDASLDPVRAALRLCERLCDGGQCNHCGRPTGLEPDSLETMPFNKEICWYVYDPELKKFRRGCEGDT
jgi:hypothetical protein